MSSQLIDKAVPETQNILFRVHLFLLYFLFLVVIHIYVPALGGGPIVPIAAHLVWMVLAAIILVAFLTVLRRSRLIVPDYAKYFLLFIVLVLLAAQFQTVVNSHVLLFRTAGLIGGLLFFIALHQFPLTEQQRDRLLLALFAACVLEAAVGLFQVFHPQARELLYFNAHWPPGSQPSGFMNQGNQLASFLATGLVISFYLIVSKLFDRWPWPLRLFFFLSITVIIMTLLETRSRAGVLGAAFGSWVLLATQWKNYHVAWRRLVLRLVALLVAITIMSVMGRLGILTTVGNKLASTVLDKQSRLEIYTTALDMFQDRPLWGHGPGGWNGQYLYYKFGSHINYWYPWNKSL